ncbi:hypothetical protein BOSEA31B_11124 [Hyphomicrobiales bacterium]|nr:hypothetical protein BOSEA31B_11124 [Hyphomicrobiales bacterium]CAH1700976.1 hypothetical protein BOSEA1005_20675 [Hyphomicrobiales bacterium]CAI0344854.1 hypothetical protein BO1005MUT1_350221 [Hyphomicrobiales bacterium]
MNPGDITISTPTRCLPAGVVGPAIRRSFACSPVDQGDIAASVAASCACAAAPSARGAMVNREKTRFTTLPYPLPSRKANKTCISLRDGRSLRGPNLVQEWGAIAMPVAAAAGSPASHGNVMARGSRGGGCWRPLNRRFAREPCRDSPTTTSMAS